MNRRRLIASLGGAAAAWPLARHARSAKLPMIGMLSPFSREIPPPSFDAFEDELAGLGWHRGENVAFEYRWADGNAERLPQLATELVKLGASLIFDLWGTPAALAAMRATTAIPIVFSATGDAIATGLVTSLGRPGGNVTGVTLVTEQTIGKQLEFLKQILPKLSLVAVLINPTNPVYDPILKASEVPASALGLRIQPMGVKVLGEFEAAFTGAIKAGAGGLVALRDPLIIMSLRQLPVLAAKYRLPAIYAVSDFVRDGGLMSYGPNIADMYRRCARIIDQILKGRKPANIPVEQATLFELVLNLTTARTLGLTLPPTLLARADEVIE